MVRWRKERSLSKEGTLSSSNLVHLTWEDPIVNEDDVKNGVEWMVKVLKKGTKLPELQKQWPFGYLHS